MRSLAARRQERYRPAARLPYRVVAPFGRRRRRLPGLRGFYAPGTRAAPRARTSTWRAKTTMRCAALYSGWHAVSTRRSYPTRRITEYSDGETIRVLSTA